MATAFGYPVHLKRGPERDHPHPAHHHGRHAAMIILAVGGALLFSVGDRADAGTVAMIPASVSVPAPVPSAADAAFDASLETLRDGLAVAEVALSASEGRVLDDSARTAVSDRIASGQAALRSGEMLSALAAPGAAATIDTDGVEAQLAVVDHLQADVVALATAVAAWEAEQARIAAEQEAARRAAEAAARTPARVGTRAATVAVAAGPHVESIWTTGGQAEIDACRGSVNVSGIAGYLGGAFYAAEHWSCGGRAWAGLGNGSLVSFPGYGLYEVSGRVGGLVYGTDASVLPGGYEGYYQTCIGGSTSNMAVWLLTRVG